MDELLCTDEAGKFITRQVCSRRSIVETDAELNAMRGATENFGNIFKYWKRVSRLGVDFSDVSNVAELEGWSYDSPTDKLMSTINSGTVIGFMSPDKFDDFIFDAQLSSVNGDDDFIGLCIAYAVDPADGKTHTLTAMRGMNGPAPLTIDKDYNGYGTSVYRIASVFNGLTWANGVVATAAGVNGANGGWSATGIGTRLRVTRRGDIITVETSQPNSNVIYDPATTTFNLATDPQLAIFRGPQSFGYMAQSQANATWAVTSRPSVSLPIIDVRTWTKYTKSDAVWTPMQTSKAALIADGTFSPGWSYTNETLGKFYFMDKQSNLYRM
jgi:hypothetical protein